MNPQMKKKITTVYNFKNNHHNIAVTVTLNPSMKEKYTVNPGLVQYSKKEKSAREPKRPKAIHSHWNGHLL